MENSGIKRRDFLIAAPAVASLAVAYGALFTPSATYAESAASLIGNPFTLFSADSIKDVFKSLVASPGNKIIYRDSNLSIMLTIEKAAAAKEFEWHEERDHVFHILEGSAVYELGGTPKHVRSPRPGEWLAPESEGAKTVTVNEGDVLVVPRGTPHRRRTPTSVKLILVSPGLPPAV
jgi:mannose-6-phosphate isomerase-like protein (cupin superfamily)